MALVAGTRLGPYEIVSPLGAGTSGIATVFSPRLYVLHWASAFVLASS